MPTDVFAVAFGASIRLDACDRDGASKDVSLSLVFRVDAVCGARRGREVFIFRVPDLLVLELCSLRDRGCAISDRLLSDLSAFGLLSDLTLTVLLEQSGSAVLSVVLVVLLVLLLLVVVVVEVDLDLDLEEPLGTASTREGLDTEVDTEFVDSMELEAFVSLMTALFGNGILFLGPFLRPFRCPLGEDLGTESAEIAGVPSFEGADWWLGGPSGLLGDGWDEWDVWGEREVFDGLCACITIKHKVTDYDSSQYRQRQSMRQSINYGMKYFA